MVAAVRRLEEFVEEEHAVWHRLLACNAAADVSVQVWAECHIVEDAPLGKYGRPTLGEIVDAVADAFEELVDDEEDEA